MEIMNEKDREKIIFDARKFGGISLRRQSLRVHKNGAKFPISKVYIDDQVLDPDLSYTLILIPEVKIATKTTIILSYFSRKIGPLVFYSYPEGNLSEELYNRITNLMDKASKEEFFVHLSSNVPSSLNYYFEIHSEWARGNKEMLLISVILDKPITQILEENIQKICNDFASQLKSIEDLFKALYMKDIESFPEKDRLDIKNINEILRTKIKEFYKGIVISIK